MKFNKVVGLITLVILLLTTIVSVIVFATNTRGDVSENSNDIQEIKIDAEKLEKHVETNKENVIVLKTTYNYIVDSLNRIEKQVGVNHENKK